MPDPGQPTQGYGTQEPYSGSAALPVVVSVALHLLVGGLVLVAGFHAVDIARRQVAPLLVADWRPPPPPRVTAAPPSLPLPGREAPVLGPASRAKGQGKDGASAAAARLGTTVPEPRSSAPAPAPRVAGTLGFEAAPATAPRAAGFAADRSRVAFVLDASGPMISVMQAAQRELGRRLMQLSADQEYVVVVARGSGAQVVPDTPNRATRQSIERTLRWLEQYAEPQGACNLGTALEAAWNAMEPNAVCVLARGGTARRGNAKADAPASATGLIAAADKLNPSSGSGRQAVFLCLELLEGSTDSELKRVGLLHGGARGYQILTRQDLGLQPRAAGQTKQGAKP